MYVRVFGKGSDKIEIGEMKIENKARALEILYQNMQTDKFSIQKYIFSILYITFALPIYVN